MHANWYILFNLLEEFEGTTNTVYACFLHVCLNCFSSTAKTVPLAAITVPSLLVVTLVFIIAVVVLIIVTWKKVKITTKQEQIYYSDHEVGPPSISFKMNKDTVYKEISTLDEHYQKEDMHSLTKTSPQEFCNKVTKTKRDPNPVRDQKSATYGTNTATAMAPDISTEKNKAYGYLESHASFTMAGNSAYGTTDVVIVDT